MFRLLIIIYVAFISLGLPDSVLGSAWPQMYGELGVGLSAAGLISSIVTAGTVVSSLISGWLIERLGTGKVTAVSAVMTAASLLGFSFSGEYWMLCALAIPLGLGAGSVDAALNNFVALHYTARHMSWLHCFWGIGATAGPIIMSYCLTWTGQWEDGYRCIGLLQTAMAVALIASLPMWRRAEAPANAAPESAKSGAGEKRPAGGRRVPVWRLPGARAAMAGFFCYNAIELTMGLWGSSYLVGVQEFAKEEAARQISLYYLGIALGRLVGGMIAERWSDERLIRVGQAVMAAGLVLFALPLPGFVGFFGLILLGIGCGPVFPCSIHLTPRRFGEENSGRLIGMQMAMAYTGNLLMPPLAGILSEHLGIGILPGFLAIFLILLICCTERAGRAAGKAAGSCG